MNERVNLEGMPIPPRKYNDNLREENELKNQKPEWATTLYQFMLAFVCCMLGFGVFIVLTVFGSVLLVAPLKLVLAIFAEPSAF